MENKAMNRTNVIYESPYTGQEETEILQHAESLKDQTRASDGNMADTVQVYDTDGVPHTISKTELISKAGVNLPSLDQIGGFVAYDKEGNALGLMSTEQVAEVVGERLPLVSPLVNGFMPKDGFIERNDIKDANERFTGYLRTMGLPNTPFPTEHGLLQSVFTGGVCLQYFLRGWPVELYWRGLWDYWHDWKRIG